MSTSRLLPHSRWITAGLLLSALALSARSAEPPVTEGKTIELPTMTVQEAADLPKLESWRYTRIPGFEVLSNGSDKPVKKLLADFQKFQQAVKLLWPTPVRPLAASSLILCGADNKFDEFAGRSTGKMEGLIPSLFIRNREQIAIVVDLQTQQISISDPTALINSGSASAEYQVDHYRQLYREYIHFLLSQSEVRPAAWLEEGLAQIIMDIDLTDKTLIYGKIDSHRGEATGGSPLEADENDATVADATVGEQPFNVVLKHRPFLPFDQFLAITHESPEAQSPLGNNLWSKQAYAFVHFCLFGEDLRHKDALITFVSRLSREPLSEALFQDCFKVGYAGMAKQLRAYIYRTKHKYQQYDLKSTDRVTAASIELAEADATQVGLIKGDALRLAGQNGKALTKYRMAYRRGSRDPAVLSGLAAVDTDVDSARKWLDAAIKAGTNRPSAYVAQAKMRLADFKSDPGPDGKLTTVQVSSILTPLFKARSFPPPLPETYETIAETWALSTVPPKPEHLGVLDEGARRFPRNSALILKAAELNQLAGASANARSLAQLGLRFTADTAIRARFEQVIAANPPPAK
jgi:hypothetical protein